MKNINLKILDSFDIKLIAFITMIIDHIGYFFYYLLSDSIYSTFRIIGRISMPLFAFLIYQGFKHTSNLKKYARRLLCLAVITQIIVIAIGIISSSIVPDYNLNFYKEINVIFSFFLSVLFIKSLDDLINKDKKNKDNLFFDIVTILAIVAFYLIFNIDYGFIILILITLIYMYDSYITPNIKSKVLKFILIFLFVSIYVMIIIISQQVLNLFSIFSIIFIFMYNGKKGNNTKRIFYYLYVLQYIIFYILGLVVYMLVK